MMKFPKARSDLSARHLVVFTAMTCAALLLLTLVSARAQTAAVPRLKPIVTVEGDTVRLGDLIDGVGGTADIALFGAPQPGASGMISTSRIVSAAREHGLTGIETSGLSSVAVRRLGRRISAEEISRAITRALIDQQQLGLDAEVELNSGQMEVTVESSATEPVLVRQLSYNGSSGRFEATFVVPGSRAMELNPGKVIGNLSDVMRVPVLARPILKGDVVNASDVVMERRRRSDMGADVYLDQSKIVGNAARRALPRGSLLREVDIQRPEIVEKNASVTITFEQPGLQLAMRGKALTGGAMGDVIQVQNLNSKKTVEATITGQNRAAVTGTVLPQKTARNGQVIQ
jgi:flagellar basal body P-ring formation protein FlgA